MKKGCFLIFVLVSILLVPRQAAAQRKNILFVFADDWGRYASAYKRVDNKPSANDLIKTPHVDQMADEGMIFRNAFVNAPSCTPCRSSLFSGRYFFNTGRGAILNGAQWDSSIPVFPLLLRDAGYHIGKSHKVWSPGTPADAPFGGQKHAYERAGRACCDFSEQTEMRINKQKMSPQQAHQEILDQVRTNFDQFMADRKPSQPWLYYFGTTTTHRKWIKGSGKAHWNINPDELQGKMPPIFPDVPEVREDFADYLGECQAVDACVGALVERLKALGELENTIVVLSGDHGFPGAPHGKCDLYRTGTSVPLVIRWPGGKPGRIIDDFVMLPDLMPTFLEIGEVQLPDNLNARSLLPLILSEKSGQIDPTRTWAVTGRERHVAEAREGNLPYPMRAVQTKDFLYIRNYQPERWPMGAPYKADQPTSEIDPQAVENNTRYCFPDFDASPTKAWMVMNRENAKHKWQYELAFGKRPGEELYDLNKDPDQIHNLAGDPEHAGQVKALARQLSTILQGASDPRVTQTPVPFELSPFTDGPQK